MYPLLFSNPRANTSCQSPRQNNQPSTNALHRYLETPPPDMYNQRGADVLFQQQHLVRVHLRIISPSHLHIHPRNHKKTVVSVTLVSV